jgi:hypothetical protein
MARAGAATAIKMVAQVRGELVLDGKLGMAGAGDGGGGEFYTFGAG